MARLSKEQVVKEITDLGYSLVSGEYKNLKSVIIVKCSEGHETTTTLHDLRKKRPCPVCSQYIKTVEEEEMLAKLPPKAGKRVLALDNATKVSGYAVFENGKLLDHGVKKLDSDTPTAMRIMYMKQWFVSMLMVWEIDVVGLENVQYQGNPKVLITLAELLGALKVASLEFNIEPYVVSSQTWKSFCKIKGRSRFQQKENAQKHIKEKYGFVATQDASDAICLGEYVAAQEKYDEGISW